MTAPSMRLIVRTSEIVPRTSRWWSGRWRTTFDVHWLLFTDRPVPDAPPNLTVHVGDFADLSARVRAHFDFDVCLDDPYKMCDFRPAFGEIFAAELSGYDFWGHCDLDVLFGRIRDHLPAEAFEADKILFQGNFSLYRNTVEAAGWYRHEVGKVSYRDAMTTPAAMHFDEWAGIYYVIRDLGVRYWGARQHLRPVVPPVPHTGREDGRLRSAPLRLGARRGVRVPAGTRRGGPAHRPARSTCRSAPCGHRATRC
jgi:hypothetical protein